MFLAERGAPILEPDRSAIARFMEWTAARGAEDNSRVSWRPGD